MTNPPKRAWAQNSHRMQPGTRVQPTRATKRSAEQNLLQNATSLPRMAEPINAIAARPANADTSQQLHVPYAEGPPTRPGSAHPLAGSMQATAQQPAALAYTIPPPGYEAGLLGEAFQYVPYEAHLAHPGIPQQAPLGPNYALAAMAQRDALPHMFHQDYVPAAIRATSTSQRFMSMANDPIWEQSEEVPLPNDENIAPRNVTQERATEELTTPPRSHNHQMPEMDCHKRGRSPESSDSDELEYITVKDPFRSTIPTMNIRNCPPTPYPAGEAHIEDMPSPTLPAAVAHQARMTDIQHPHFTRKVHLTPLVHTVQHLPPAVGNDNEVMPRPGSNPNTVNHDILLRQYHQLLVFSPLNRASTFPAPTSFLTLNLIGGFPFIFTDRPQSFWEGLSLTQYEQWCTFNENCVAIVTFGATANDLCTNFPVMSSIVAIIKRKHPTVNVQLGPPRAATENQNSGHPPRAFLCFNMMDELKQAFLTQYMYSTLEISFYCVDTRWTIPNFICSVSGFMFSVSNSFLAEVRARLESEETLRNLIQIIGQENIPRAQRTIASFRLTVLDIKRRGSNLTPVVNIYCEPPMDILPIWIVWRNYIYNLKFETSLLGTGTGTQNWYCTICHAFDHPRGLCPFPDILGWNGPLHRNSQEDDATGPPNEPVAGPSDGPGTHAPCGRQGGRNRGGPHR
ncbi:hypothetical protein BKA93DRAFT_753069 [Sparassis latifolia]